MRGQDQGERGHNCDNLQLGQDAASLQPKRPNIALTNQFY